MKNSDLEAFRTAMGSKTRNTQKMKIFYSELNHRVEPDGFAHGLLNDTMPDWIYKRLRKDMVNSLKGFTSDMALEIADNLIDCWSGLGLHVTGIKHVDELLGRLYMRILTCAHNQGIVLEYKL